jgi:ABC-type dipeptide/oligopeptide/nickel transport system permease subunit
VTPGGSLRHDIYFFVSAARAIGSSERRILWRHVAVNTFGSFAVALPLAAVLLALMLAALNFLSDVLSERLDPVRRRAV